MPDVVVVVVVMFRAWVPVAGERAGRRAGEKLPTGVIPPMLAGKVSSLPFLSLLELWAHEASLALVVSLTQSEVCRCHTVWGLLELRTWSSCAGLRT